MYESNPITAVLAGVAAALHNAGVRRSGTYDHAGLALLVVPGMAGLMPIAAAGDHLLYGAVDAAMKQLEESAAPAPAPAPGAPEAPAPPRSAVIGGGMIVGGGPPTAPAAAPPPEA